MLKIAICDDEILYCRLIKKIVSEYCAGKKIEYQIQEFPSGDDFIALESKMNQFQVVYLDINMDGTDGVETAEKIRKWCKDTFIIFVTAFINYSLEGYRVGAIRYILKDNNSLQANIEESLNAVLEKMELDTSTYVFNFKEGTRELLFNQIAVIESNLHSLRFTVIMKTEEKQYTMIAKLNDMEALLKGKNFIRIHQGYMVNLRFVKDVANYEVMLWNGETLPVSRPRYRDVKEKFLLYEGEV